jgi:dipeptidyl aminopeptidase/acylaminoacyl peptidase
MRSNWLVAGMCIAACAAWSASAAPALEAFGQLPSLDNFAVSPNGKNIAYATFVNGKRTVLVNSLDEGKVVGGFAIENKLRELRWGDDDHVLATFSTTHTMGGAISSHAERWMTESYSVSDKEGNILLARGQNHVNTVAALPVPRTVNGRPVAYVVGWTFIDQRSVEALFVEDLAAGGHGSIAETGTLIQSSENHIVETGSPKYWTDWIIDDSGTIIARTLYEDDTGRWSLQIKHGAGYTDAYVITAPLDAPSVSGITPDGKSILIEATENGNVVMRQFSLADAHAETPLFTETGLAPIVDPNNGRIVGTAHYGLHTKLAFFDPADQAVWNGLTQAFPDESVTLESWSHDHKIVVVRVDGKRDGTGYFLINRSTHQASFLGPTYNGIDVADIADKTAIEYTAQDGTKIPAFLTLPNGKAAKGLPLIVLPHGGPAAHDDAQFDWLSQALADRGYAVLQPQFRGSAGFGQDFLEAGYGQWGRKMQTDLSDGVRYLASQGMIDPKRVCIVGASYGGYAALAGATLDRGVYRCAVSDSGVSDPQSMMQWYRDRTRESDSEALRFWDRFMGVGDRTDPKLDEISPLRHVAEVNIPVLLIHGSDDTVVPIGQSEQFDAAMRAAGKPVTFVRLNREDHWLSTSQTRTEMLKATVDFLKANNPPD